MTTETYMKSTYVYRYKTVHGYQSLSSVMLVYYNIKYFHTHRILTFSGTRKTQKFPEMFKRE